MRGRILAGALLIAGLLTPATPAAAQEADCGGTSCGVPECWGPQLHTRPGLERTSWLNCRGIVEVRVVKAPLHADVVSIDGATVVLRGHDDAPREDEATFELIGKAGSVEQVVPIVIRPLSENHAPVCYGTKVGLRTDGEAPAEVLAYPLCADWEHDDFVMYGDGPGTHLDSPKSVPAGSAWSHWRYRTATADGTETSRLWAVDGLGARSEDALLEVSVGRGVDRPVWCHGMSSYNSEAAVAAIHSRAGQTRRFGMECDDPDGDAFVSAPSALPSRGALISAPTFTHDYSPWSGFKQYHDATYVPADQSTEPDEFGMSAVGARGTTQSRLAITPRPHSENGGGSCGFNTTEVVSGVAAVLEASCYDDEGDPLTAHVSGGPLHGVTGPATVTTGLYGVQTIAIPYVSTPGYEGYDCVKVVIEDGHGMKFEISVDLQVKPFVELPPIELPELPEVPEVVEPPELSVPRPLPGLPGPVPAPGVAPVPPSQVAALARSEAREMLGTATVQRVATSGEALVYAPAELPRRELLRSGKAPAVFVVCPAACRIRSAARLFTGRRARGARHRAVTDAPAGTGQLLWLDLDATQRRSLKRARQARAAFSVRVDGRTARRSIRIAP